MQNTSQQTANYHYPQHPTITTVYISDPISYVPKNVSTLNQPTAPNVAQNKSKGFFSSVAKAMETGLNTVVHEVDKSIKLALPSANDARIADGRFRSNFGLPLSEPLLFEFPLKAATQTNVLTGFMYLSPNYICLYFEVDWQSKRIYVMIPQRDIVNIQRAVVIKSQKEHLPNIVPLQSIPQTEKRLPDQYVIELVTSDGNVHQLFSFGNQYELIFNQIENTWRSCPRNIPLPQPGARGTGSPVVTTTTTQAVYYGTYPPPQQGLYPLQPPPYQPQQGYPQQPPPYYQVVSNGQQTHQSQPTQ